MLKQPVPGTALAMGIIVLFMALNIIGIKESTKVNVLLIVIGIVTQVALVITGLVLILIPHPQTLMQNMFGQGNWPSTTNLVFGIAIASSGILFGATNAGVLGSSRLVFNLATQR